jgi:hypothetical protein
VDWQKLDANLAELDRNYIEYYRSINVFATSLELKVLRNEYTKEDMYSDVHKFRLALTNPRFALRALQHECITVYPLMNVEDRETMRMVFKKYDMAGSGEFLQYIMECAECLESPADEYIFRLALIALSIHDFHPDFRDTGAVMAELVLAAVRTKINMEPHCIEIAELSADRPYLSMKEALAGFHLSAATRKRIFDDEFMSYYEGML